MAFAPKRSIAPRLVRYRTETALALPQHPAMKLTLRLPSQTPQVLATQHDGIRACFGAPDCSFGISKVALDMEGLVTSVLWETMGHVANQNTAHEAVVSVKAVVAAIRDGHPVVAIFPGAVAGLPERRFVVEERGWKGASVVLDGPPTPGRNLYDLHMLFLEGVGAGASPSNLQVD